MRRGTWTVQPLVMVYKIDTTAGQSGSPLLTSGCGTYCVAAVHHGASGGDNIGARIVTGNNSIQTINKVR